MDSPGQLPNFAHLLNNIHPIQPPTNIRFVPPLISNNQDMDDTYNSLISTLHDFNNVNNYLIYLIRENSQNSTNQLIYQFNQTIENYPKHFSHVHSQLIGLYNMVNGPKPTDGLMIAMRSIDKQFTKNPNLQPDQSVPDQNQPNQNNAPQQPDQPDQADKQAAQALGQLHAHKAPSSHHVHFLQPGTYKLPFPPETAHIPVPITPFEQNTNNQQPLPTPNSPQSMNSSPTNQSNPPTTSAQTPSSFNPNQSFTPPLLTPSPPKSRYHSFGKRLNTIPLECAHCHKRNTPEWRKGPDNERNLCNACGIFYAKLVKIHGNSLAKIILIIKQARNENKDCSKDRSLPRTLEVESYIKIYNEEFVQHVPA